MILTLKDIVDDVLNEIGTYDEHEYLRYLKLAMRGFTRLNLFHMSNIRVAYLPVSDINTVTLPSDYVAYTKIGINVNGNIWTLGLNDKMAFAREESCGLRINELADVTDVSTYSTCSYIDHTKDGVRVTNLFGIGGGFNVAYYRVDREMGVIQFQGGVPQSEVVLEYVSNGIKTDGVTIVPVEAREAIIAWIHWKRKINDPKFTINDRLSSKQEYLEEVNELRCFEDSFTLDEMMDVFYEGYKQTPKR